MPLDEAELSFLRCHTEAQILGDTQHHLATGTGVHRCIDIHVLGCHLGSPYGLAIIDLFSDDVFSIYFLLATGAQCQILT